MSFADYEVVGYFKPKHPHVIWGYPNYQQAFAQVERVLNENTFELVSIRETLHHSVSFFIKDAQGFIIPKNE